LGFFSCCCLHFWISAHSSPIRASLPLESSSDRSGSSFILSLYSFLLFCQPTPG
jgi:hypothetical protein